MYSTLTADQKRRVTAMALGTFALGLGIGFAIAVFFKDKKIAKLESKIFKLEGWQ